MSDVSPRPFKMGPLVLDEHYVGDMSVGGAVQVRRLPGVLIAKVAVGPMSNNAYLIRCLSTGEGLLIDAANEAARLQDFVRIEGPPVSIVLTTHRHPDHWQALVDVVEDAGAATFAGEDDADELPVAVDERLAHGDTITVGDLLLDVIALRGHTPGSVAVAYRDADGRSHLFTGDSLFPGGVGKTWSPEDFPVLIADVEARLFDVYDDETWVYPGHGNDTTIGAERPSLPEWHARGW